MGQWIRDYGGFVAAVLVVVMGLVNVLLTASSARRSKREEWLRETRMPVYLEFARSVAELGTQAMMTWERKVGVEHWEDLGDSFEDLVRVVWRRAADVVLVGPEDVAQRANQLTTAVLRYWQGTYRESGATTEESKALEDAFTAYRQAARAVLALPT